MNEIEIYFANPIAIAGFSILIIEAVKSWVKMSDRQIQLVSWLIAAALCLLGHSFNLGMFKDMPIPLLLFTILLTGPASNGLYSFVKPKDGNDVPNPDQEDLQTPTD